MTALFLLPWHALLLYGQGHGAEGTRKGSPGGDRKLEGNSLSYKISECEKTIMIMILLITTTTTTTLVMTTTIIMILMMMLVTTTMMMTTMGENAGQ